MARFARPAVGLVLTALAIGVSACGGSPTGDDYPSLPPVAVSSQAVPAPATDRPTTADDAPTAWPSPTVISLPPPYIARTQWVETEVGPSLQVYPTDAGRRVTEPGAQDTAWREVIAQSSSYGQYSASSPGMRAQFDCHWVWARAVAPDKPSWNLEPGRPVVDENAMVTARCNPGAPEE